MAGKLLIKIRSGSNLWSTFIVIDESKKRRKENNNSKKIIITNKDIVSFSTKAKIL
jgi:hypothetical protein